ncbi:MAG: phytanoyl-CoA dioxygenase family protein [Myxococcota bacterium]
MDVERGRGCVLVIWALNDVTAENGRTRVIPGSHRWGDRNPTPEDLDRVVSVEMPAGSMVFFLGTLWHGGGANSADHGRLCMTAQYCEPWCRTVENYSRSMPLDLVRECSPELQRMLGFSIHPPLMGYVDGRHPGKLL